MCGLGGVARLGSGATLAETDRAVLHRMLATLGHRGPDETNIADRGGIGLAFTRLSLMGVSDGNQPFENADSSIALMANGEVYNHVDIAASRPGYRPSTRSDCEVLLPLYEEHGTDFLGETRGILAVAVHDAARHRLVLAVDPFANKPLYYFIHGGLVVFGSEMKSLFNHPEVPRRIEWARALADQGLVNFPAITAEPVNTWFEGIRKVAGGTAVTIDLLSGQVSVHTYWQLGFGNETVLDLPRSPEAWAAAYRDLLVSSVQDSLMSEVGLGLFLSGGVDSAAIAAIASSLDTPLRTFTVATEATVLNGDVSASRDLAHALGLEHTVLSLDTHDVPGVDDWNRLLWLMESPLTGPEQYYKFSLHRVAKHIHPGLKAMLLGAGADEFNGGYSQMLSGGLGWDVLEANLSELASAEQSPSSRWWQGPPQGGLLRGAATGEKWVDDPYRSYVEGKYRDVQQYNCWLEDRCAAGNGIEARVPFLDRRLVDLTTAIPRELRSSLLWDKEIARSAVRTFLPESIVRREKKPFYDGSTARYAHRTILAMLRQEGGALVEQALSGPAMSEHVDPTVLRQAVAGTTDERVHPEVLLRLVNLGILDVAVREESRIFRAEQVCLRGAWGTTGTATSPDQVLLRFSDLRPGPELVLRFASGADLARSATDPDLWLLLQDYAVQFTVRESLDPDWVQLLLNIDGSRSLGEISAKTGVAWDTCRDYLKLCLERAMLQPVTTEEAS